MIRDAVQDDIPALLDMGERFAAKAQLDSHIGYEPASMVQTFTHLIDSDLGILKISDSGAIGGLCHPHPFNHQTLVGQELFWWSEGRGGLLLFDAAEQQAKALGARFWSMITLEALRPEAVGRLYERRGYRALERSYIKEL